MKPLALGLVLSLFSPLVLANLEINRASQAELERLSGVGPRLSTRILTARASRSFSDWEDLHARVSGMGPRQSARLSKEGLTVAGASFAATDSMLMPLKKSGRQASERTGSEAP